MESSVQSDGLNALLDVDGDMNVEAENAKNETEMTKCDALNAEALVKRLKNIREWSTQPYAILHECLEDPRGEPRQLTEEDWIHYEFLDKETVQFAVDYLVSNKRILLVNGEYQMLRKTRFSTGLEKKSHQFQRENDTDSSSLSASNRKYPFSHVHHYLKVKDESRCAPLCATADTISLRE